MHIYVHSSALDKETNEKVAIKKIPRVFDDLLSATRALREIKLLSSFNHPNVSIGFNIMYI